VPNAVIPRWKKVALDNSGPVVPIESTPSYVLRLKSTFEFGTGVP